MLFAKGLQPATTLVEHSSPDAFAGYGPVAQWIEQGTPKPLVGGSIPSGPARKYVHSNVSSILPRGLCLPPVYRP
jgi:hypothetical protein